MRVSGFAAVAVMVAGAALVPSDGVGGSVHAELVRWSAIAAVSRARSRSRSTDNVSDTNDVDFTVVEQFERRDRRISASATRRLRPATGQVTNFAATPWAALAHQSASFGAATTRASPTTLTSTSRPRPLRASTPAKRSASPSARRTTSTSTRRLRDRPVARYQPEHRRAEREDHTAVAAATAAADRPCRSPPPSHSLASRLSPPATACVVVRFSSPTATPTPGLPSLPSFGRTRARKQATLPPPGVRLFLFALSVRGFMVRRVRWVRVPRATVLQVRCLLAAPLFVRPDLDPRSAIQCDPSHSRTVRASSL